MDASRYRELFLTEARDHLTAINQALIELEQAPPEASRESLDAIFRAVHTVKGMSGVMGYDAVTTLSHAMESLLAQVRAGTHHLDAAEMALLFDAADALEQAVEASVAATNDQRQGAPASALDVRALVDRLEDREARRRTDRAAASRDDTRPALVLAPGPGAAVHVELEPGTVLPGARAALVLARARSLGTVAAVSPAEGRMTEDRFDGRFVFRLDTAADDVTIERTLRAAGAVGAVRVMRDGDGAPAEPHGFDDAWRTGALRAPLQQYVRIDLRRLDQLMNLVGELMIVRGRLAQGAARHDDPALDQAVQEASRLISAVHDGVLGGRMVPVWQVFDRFPRVVRDAARMLGKEVEFVVEGRDIELDRVLLEQIAEPLVHLLRNAVDHGVEAPETRVAAGKRAAGRLTLSAARERNAVVIAVRDDGGGIDRQRVLRKAQAMGVVDAERDALDDDELLRLIARPGFSTADRVTELSGRGVGIDAVVSRVRAMGGGVELRTSPGGGTSFAIRLPVTLAVIPALLSRVGDESYALPLTHVTETLQLARGAVRSVRGREVIVLRDEVLPLLHLRQVVGLPPCDTTGSHVVIVTMADRKAGVVVDRLVGQEELVVKPFDAVRGATACFNGATILGDGSAALFLDVSSLL